MSNDAVTGLLAELNGATVVDVTAGPAGVHYDFGKIGAATGRKVDFSILSNTPIAIHSKTKERLFACGPYPPFSCQDELRKHLLGFVVTAAQFDGARNAAHIILGEHVLPSLTPIKEDAKIYWAIYGFNWNAGTRNVSRGYVVTADTIEMVTTDKAR